MSALTHTTSAVSSPTVSGELELDAPVLAPHLDDQFDPEIAFDGTNFWVVFVEQKYSGRAEIRGVRISPLGHVLDPKGIRLASLTWLHPSSFIPVDVSIACITGQCLVSYSAYWDYGPYETRAFRIDADGNRLEQQDMVVEIGGLYPKVATDGANYLVAVRAGGSGGYELRARRISAGGQFMEAQPFVIASSQRRLWLADIAFGQSTYLLTYVEGQSPYDHNAVRVSTAGAVLDPGGISLCTQCGGRLSMVAGAGKFLVTRPGSTGLHGQFITEDGVIDPQTFSPAGVRFSKALTYDGHSFVVSWPTLGGIVTSRLSDTGALLDPTPRQVATRLGRSGVGLSAASDGHKTLMVWNVRELLSGLNLYAARISRSGAILDSGGFIPYGQDSRRSMVELATNGDGYFAAWSDDRNGSMDIYGVRLDETGAALQASPMAIGTDPAFDALIGVASDGSDYLVVWRNALYSRLWAHRIDGATGAVLDHFEIEVGLESAPRGNVVFGAGHYLVIGKPSPQSGMHAVRIAPDGEVLGASTAEVVPPEASSSEVATVYGGHHFMVAYAQDDKIFAVPVDHRGIPGTPVQVAVTLPAATDIEYVSVAFDGDHFLVGWAEDTWSNSLVRLARIDATGNLIQTGLANPSELDTRGDKLALSGDKSATLFLQDHVNPGGSQPHNLEAAVVGNQTTAEPPFVLAASDMPHNRLESAASTRPGSHLVAYTRETDFGERRLYARRVEIPLPFAAHSQSVFTREETPVRVDLSGHDPDGGALTFSLASQPAHGTFTGTLPALTYIPDPDFVGTDVFEFAVTNPQGATDTARVWVTVDAVNDAPEALDDSFSTHEDAPIEIDVLANDTDVEDVTVHRASLCSFAEHGELIELGEGRYRYEPERHFVGTDSFCYEAFDSEGLRAEATVTIEVTPVNDVPSFIAPTPREGTRYELRAGDVVEFQIAASDVEDAVLTYGVDPLPPTANFSAQTGEFRWQPTWREAGEYRLTLFAEEAVGTRITRHIEVAVQIEDADADGIPDDLDNCPQTANADQFDNDADDLGDVCDPDDDDDSIDDVEDACPFDAGGDIDGCPVGEPDISDPDAGDAGDEDDHRPGGSSGGCSAGGDAAPPVGWALLVGLIFLGFIRQTSET
ncbi:Ig-like domain-containing protein [Persicimonas caeni]|nr:Ig-like domain-containing protein [Persicimonas caeni]